MVELYANSNIITKEKSNDILSKSYSSSNYNINSQIITSSSSDEGASSHLKFKIQLLKRISTESFEIKSSYKNLNILSKGKIFKNEKFWKYLENSINIYFNKYGDENKKGLSLFSSQKLNNKYNEDYFIDNLDQIKINNENELFSKGNLTTISKKKYLNIISDVPNHLLNKKTFLNIKKENTTNGKPASTGEINKNSFNLFEKLENSEKIKLSSFKKFDNELKKFSYNIKNNISEKNNLKGNLIKKNLQKSNISNKIKEEMDYKNKKSEKSPFKDICESENSNNENKFVLINKSNNINNSSSSNIIQNNNFEVKKTNICYVF